MWKFSIYYFIICEVLQDSLPSLIVCLVYRSLYLNATFLCKLFNIAEVKKLSTKMMSSLLASGLAKQLGQNFICPLIGCSVDTFDIRALCSIWNWRQNNQYFTLFKKKYIKNNYSMCWVNVWCRFISLQCLFSHNYWTWQCELFSCFFLLALTAHLSNLLS